MNRDRDFVLKTDRQSGRATREPKHSHRHDIWLWLCLDRYENAELDPATCNGITMRDVIARYLKGNPDLFERIDHEKDRFMVGDDCLKWIEEDRRQYEWLLGRIERTTGLGLSRRLVHLTGRNHLIAMFDLWNVDIGDKADEIERLRNHWIRHKARDKDFKWFEDKTEGSQRCKCAWEWLNTNPASLLSLRPPISNLQELLMFFDQAEYGPNEQKAIIEKIKQSWRRKKYSERTKAAGRFQVNVELSSTAIDLLDELAQKHDLTRPQVVERLIIMESGMGMIEKYFTRHASKEIAAETVNSTPTQPARAQVIIDKSPAALLAPQNQPTLEAKPEPSSAFMSDSANPVIDHPVSENLEAQPNKNASSHVETDRPPLNIQATTQSPPSRGERPQTLGEMLREKEEEESRRLKAEIGSI
jgi:hypothetical protein